MNSGMTGPYSFPPGRKGDEMRAKDVYRRLMAASAMTTDLSLEVDALKTDLELAELDHQPQDLKTLRSYLDKASDLLNTIYLDVNEITGQQLPERVSDMEAYQFVQPALRIEAKAQELRQWLTRANDAKTKLDQPRVNSDKIMTAAERKRLQADAELAEARRIVSALQASRAENYPEASAALLTAEREIFAGSQMVHAAQQAIGRKAYREAVDLAERSQKILDSGINRFFTIKQANQEHTRAADAADEALQKALQRLQEAKNTLAVRASLLTQDPNAYLQSVVQRIGEARRAFRANPPQHMTTYRLATEALTLIDDILSRADEETRLIRDSRINARQLNQQLLDAVLEVRQLINSRQSVPVRANELYTRARAERDRLGQTDIDDLSFGELKIHIAKTQVAIQTAQDAIQLISKI